LFAITFEKYLLWRQAMVTVISIEILGGARLAGKHLGAEEMSHTLERYHKRIETASGNFRGRVLASGQSQQINIAFPTLSEASLSVIEIQRRIADLPPVSGVRLSARIGIHEAKTEEEAEDVALQLMNFALPEQILCGREILLDQVHSIGVGLRDLHQTKLRNGEDFQVVELLWRDDEVPVSLTATSVLSLADLEAESFAVGNNAPVQPASPPPEADAGNFALPGAEIKTKLCVRYQGKAFLLDAKTPFVTMGRDRNNDLVINDNRVSRQHARIERKGDRYYLADMSTNGTFMLVIGGQEIFLRKDSTCLTGNGILSFGASVSRGGEVAKIEFEFL
jgi:hypothetical protein